MGETGSGKSTLFKQLIGSKASNGTPLPHMEMATFEFPSRLKVRRDKPRVTFHMIDFAGSEIYRSVACLIFLCSIQALGFTSLNCVAALVCV